MRFESSNGRTMKQRAGIAVALTGGIVLLFLLLTVRSAPPRISEVAKDERIVFLPTHAAFDAKKKLWRVHVHAWVHEPETTGVRRRAARAAFRKKVGVPDDPAARKRFERIVAPFLYDNERGKPVVVKLGTQTHPLGETGKDGHVRTTLELSVEEFQALPRRNGAVAVTAALERGDARTFRGAITPIPAEGISVISDIDDTIRITQVTNRGEMLANTFYRPFKPAPGMAELYRKLQKQGAVFHYVSASPWQLHPPLEEFRKSHGFPAGVFHLRRLRLLDVASLDAESNAAGKKERILELLKEFPRRRFLLVGDSGEGDPEIYGDMKRQFPQQILGIAIRNVSKQPRTHARYQKAFRDIPEKRAIVFDKPNESTTVIESWR